jgi:hypothetical protein
MLQNCTLKMSKMKNILCFHSNQITCMDSKINEMYLFLSQEKKSKLDSARYLEFQNGFVLLLLVPGMMLSSL